MQIITLNSLKGLSNTYIIKNNNKCFIIDSGVTIGAVKNAVENCTVEGVLLTHAHFDHITYLEDYVKTFNCKVFCSSIAFDKLNKPNKNLSSYFLNDGIVVEIDNYICLDNISKITLADTDIKIIEIKGHSDCSLGYVIQDNIFCGDVLFENAVGRTDFYDGDIKKLEKSIQQIINLAPINVFSGHGNNFSL